MPSFSRDEHLTSDLFGDGADNDPASAPRGPKFADFDPDFGRKLAFRIPGPFHVQTLVALAFQAAQIATLAAVNHDAATRTEELADAVARNGRTAARGATMPSVPRIATICGTDIPIAAGLAGHLLALAPRQMTRDLASPDDRPDRCRRSSLSRSHRLASAR